MFDKKRTKLSLHLIKIVARYALAGVGAASLANCNALPTEGQPSAPHEQARQEGDVTAAAKVANKYLSASTPGNAAYLIGPQDVLDVMVYKAPDVSRSVPVAEDGSINLPLIGRTPAAGKSAAELEREIQKRLDAGFMRSPQVTVSIKEYNSQRVTLEGAVKNPGVFPLKGNDTLQQAIAKGGGVDRTIASDAVLVFRNSGGSRTMVRYDLGAIRTGAAEDPQVMPGDVILVEDSTTKEGINIFLKVLPVAGYATPFI